MGAWEGGGQIGVYQSCLPVSPGNVFTRLDDWPQDPDKERMRPQRTPEGVHCCVERAAQAGEPSALPPPPH